MEVRTGTAKSGDIEIYYEDIGNPDDPAVLLIMGLGAQLTVWRKRFCEKIVNLGMRVIRFDNRDVGLSTKFDGRRVRTPLPLRLMRMYLGLPSPGVYTLEDMASGDVIFSATGVTDGSLLEGVHFRGDFAETETVIMRAKTGTVRRIKTTFRNIGTKLAALY